MPILLRQNTLSISLTVAQNEDVVEQFLKENRAAGMPFTLQIISGENFVCILRVLLLVHVYYFVLSIFSSNRIHFSNMVSFCTMLVSCQMLCASLVDIPHS